MPRSSSLRTAVLPTDVCRDWCTAPDRLGVAAWGISPEGKICFFNRKAEQLFGRSASECIGRPCNEVISGRDQHGHSCAETCPLKAPDAAERVPEPRTLQIGHNGSARWVQVVPILPMCREGLHGCAIETAVDVDRWVRMENYARQVAAAEEAPAAEPVDDKDLTPREQEVLEALADGMTQHDVARRFHVCYTTIRTHVQRIQSKLRVRSIQAAIARFLLQ